MYTDRKSVTGINGVRGKRLSAWNHLEDAEKDTKVYVRGTGIAIDEVSELRPYTPD